VGFAGVLLVGCMWGLLAYWNVRNVLLTPDGFAVKKQWKIVAQLFILIAQMGDIDVSI
jgi:hypothetical protein